jgi:hypothetical protein
MGTKEYVMMASGAIKSGESGHKKEGMGCPMRR